MTLLDLRKNKIPAGNVDKQQMELTANFLENNPNQKKRKISEFMKKHRI